MGQNLKFPWLFQNEHSQEKRRGRTDLEEREIENEIEIEIVTACVKPCEFLRQILATE